MNRKTMYIENSRPQTSEKFRQGGFTLVELMIALVLSLFLIGGAILISTSGKATYTDSEKLSRAQESIRFASDFFIRDLRNTGFRDELTLTVPHELKIRENYAQVTEGGKTLSVRYAGRGHCTQNFDTFRVVENEYTLNNRGELTCRGRWVQDDDSWSGWDPPIGLISGVTDVSFQIIYPNPANEICNLEGDALDRCVGVRAGIQFESVRDLDNPGTFEDRFVELTATFRNAALPRIFGDLE